MHMGESLQELLLRIPLYQLTFMTPVPKQSIYYEELASSIPNSCFHKPTLLVIQNERECLKLNDGEMVNRLIQDTHLIGIVIFIQGHISIQKESLFLLTQCQVPVLKVEDTSALAVFQQKNKHGYSYSQISMELNGFIQKGFTNITTELSMALETPFIYLDEHEQLLWHTGDEGQIDKALQWIHSFQVVRNGALHSNWNVDNQQENAEFEPYSIDIAGQLNLTLIVSGRLIDWERKLVYKLIGLTALFFHTEELFREQQERFKEHFLYDLLYHKFDSVKVMVKQGKALGWNLERSHHLLVIHFEEDDSTITNVDLKEEIVAFLEERKVHINEKILFFSFQDQIVVLLEDTEKRILQDRKNFSLGIAKIIEHEIRLKWPTIVFCIGVGKWYQESINLNKSYQEAKLALQFGRMWDEHKQLIHIDDLGIFHLLIHLHQDLLYDFSQDYLSLLIESDSEYGTEYIKTLKAYIQYQGIITDVSEALYIHPNTLRNRMKKVEEITGIDIQNPTEFMNLVVAMKIYYSIFL